MVNTRNKIPSRGILFRVLGVGPPLLSKECSVRSLWSTERKGSKGRRYPRRNLLTTVVRVIQGPSTGTEGERKVSDRVDLLTGKRSEFVNFVFRG